MQRRTFLVLMFLLATAWPPAARAHAGYGIVVDEQGRVCFLDSTRSRIWRVEPNGNLTSLASNTHGNNLALDAAGNLYAQNFNQTIWKITPEGKVTPVLEGSAIGALNEFLTVDAAGNLILAEGNDFNGRRPRLLKRSADGQVSELGSGLGVFVSAAWGADGSLYLAESTRVRRLSPDGSASIVAEGFQRLMGIAVDAAGTTYVVDSDAFSVLRIPVRGERSVVARTWLPWKPAAVAAHEGNIFVLERMFVPFPFGLQTLFRTHRVRRIFPDGRQVTLATVGGTGTYVVLASLLGTGGLVYWWRRRRRAAKAGKPTPTQLHSHSPEANSQRTGG